jgi:uncharacterized protein (TIGR00369 family)
MSWASERLDGLKAGTIELLPVVKTLQLGGLDDWRPGWVRKVWHPKPELLQGDGTMFGGYLAALGDQMLGFAAMSVLPATHAFKTIGLSLQFFRVSRNEPVAIEARVVAQSSQLVSVEAEFRDPRGELLAKAAAQQMLVPIPRQQLARRSEDAT